MREELHPGVHPDADVLNAFMEGALAEHERTECFTHLAECARCRDIVYLAQPAMAVATPKVWWRRIFRPAYVLPLMATALLAVGTVGFYRMIRSAERQPRQVTAETNIIPAAPAEQVEPPAPVRQPVATPGAAPKKVTPPIALPDRSTPASLAVKGGVVVAIDAAGRLFVSEDAGKSWTNVNGKWRGKAVRVAVNAAANFELTTDPASAWQSADGRKWSKARKAR